MTYSDICENKHGGNPESTEAYQASSESERRAMRERIYAYAKLKGSDGITADEVAERSGLVHNRVAPRISELRRDGLLVETDRRRRTRLGRTARVLVANTVARGAQ